jgi:hypothetical protein
VNFRESLSTVSVDDKNLIVFSEDIHEKELQEDEKLIDFLPFISEGTVALPEGNDNVECPKRMLRDTGSSLSVLLAGVLLLSKKTFTRQSVLLQGVKMGKIEVSIG